MEWLLKKANPDTERLHLNKILQEIATETGRLDTADGDLDADITAIEADIVEIQAVLDFTTLVDAVDDAAAAAALVPVGSLYRNGSVVMVRVA